MSKHDDVTLIGDPGAPGGVPGAAPDPARSGRRPARTTKRPDAAAAGRPASGKRRRRVTEMLEGGPSPDAGARRSRSGSGGGRGAGGGSGSGGGREPATKDKRSGWGWILLLAIIVALVLAKWTLLVAILGLAFLITVHEFGHFILAKKLGMRVERFFVGFPPAIWRRKRGDTEYGIGMIPLGGFCKISGMSEEEELTPDVEPFAYYNRPVWKRNLVIFAGPLMNVVAAVAILFVFLVAQGTITATLTLGEIVEGTPAAEAGLEPGDTLVAGRVVQDDGAGGPPPFTTFTTWDDASVFLAAHPDTSVELRYRPAGSGGDGAGAAGGDENAGVGEDAGGPVRTVEVRLERNPRDRSAGYLGVRAGETRERPAPWAAGWMALKGTGEIVVKTFQGFWWLLSGKIDATGPNGAAGPVGIIDVSTRAVQQGFYPILLALLSVNLAIINLVPILPFDGGHILLNTLERVRGKKMNPRVMERFATVGVVLVLALFLYLTLGDVRRLFG